MGQNSNQNFPIVHGQRTLTKGLYHGKLNKIRPCAGTNVAAGWPAIYKGEPEDVQSRVKRAGNRRKRWGMVLCLTGGILAAAGLYIFYAYVYAVAPAFSERIWEYGDEVSHSIEDYLVGTDWSVHLGELDLSQVDEENTGAYEAVVYHGASQFRYSVIIQDTVPPEIQWRENSIYLAAGVSYAAEDMVAGVTDADAQTEVYVVWAGASTGEVRFDRPGEYALEIRAKDRSGNEAGGTVLVTVDTAPVISGLRNFYVVPGSSPRYLESVSAWDDVDGDLTQEIRVDDSEVALESDGVYPVYYLAEDGYGLETRETAWVTVASAESIQEMIGERRIDRRTASILGAYNIYDAGVSETENIEEMLEYMRPALVQLYHATGRGGYTSGSGYIVEITEDTIYICSNSHVVEKYETWDVYFYDGTKVPGQVVGCSVAYDVGVVAVPLADVGKALLDRLMTVHIDRTYWESLDEQPIEVALERVDRGGGLLHITRGNLVKARQEFPWLDMREHTEVTVELVHGDSGSALLDGYGNLICMAYSYTSAPRRNWCVPLDGILECYEEITGRRLYVY